MWEHSGSFLRCSRVPLVLAALLGLLNTGVALAQVDLSGNWQPTDSPDQLHQTQGPFAADFLGMPLNAQARELGAEATGDYLEQLQRQCETWLVQYFIEGPFAIEFKPVEEPIGGDIIGWHMNGTVDRQPLTIWIDGRKPPAPQALHTLGGYAVGQWEGDTLVAQVTHIEDGALVRNGAPASNQEVFDMFINSEGELMTITGIIHDPVYLSGPFPRARTFRYTKVPPRTDFAVNHCAPAEVVEGLSDGYHSAQYLPGKNPQVDYMQQNYNLPPAVSLGGPEEQYPEFREKLRTTYKYSVPAGYCQHACCSAIGLVGTMCPVPPKPPAKP